MIPVLSAAVLSFSLASQPAAQTQTREGVMGDLLRDINQVEQKIVGLAKALPASAYDWRPGKGVRSTGEVFMHIASDNYFMPVMVGTPAPAETRITKEYSTAEAFEKQTMSRDAIVAELEKSFAFLKASMNATPDAKMDVPTGTGRNSSPRTLWISTTTHLHEHLGQLIAYARANNVVPPWSK